MIAQRIENLRNELIKDKEFYKNLIKIALPIVVQNFIASSLNLVDTVMMAGLGETEIAAVGQANAIFFVMSLFLFGLGSGSAVLTAQFWGDGNKTGIKKILGIGLIFGTALSSIFSILAIAMPGNMIAIFTEDAEVIRLGSQYLIIVAFSYVITAFTYVYSSVLRSTGNVRLPMIASIFGLGTNTLLNWILIYGKFGFPMLGVRGAAIATVISRVIEIGIIIFFNYKMKLPCAASLKEMFVIGRDYIEKFIKVSSPVILNEGLWGLGTTIYSVVYGHMGTNVYSAIAIENTIDKLAFILIIGIGNACSIMLGNEIGAGNNEKAHKYAVRFLYLSVIVGLFISVIIFTLSWKMVSIYNVIDDVKNMAQNVMKAFALVMTFKCFNFISIVGIFRSGGDTRFSLMLDACGVWLIGVPNAIIGGLLLKLDVHWVFLMVNTEEIIKVFFCLWRFKSKKWVHNLNMPAIN